MLHVDIPQYNSAKHESESRKCTCTWKLLVYSLLFQPREGGDSHSEKVGVVHLKLKVTCTPPEETDMGMA